MQTTIEMKDVRINQAMVTDPPDRAVGIYLREKAPNSDVLVWMTSEAALRLQAAAEEALRMLREASGEATPVEVPEPAETSTEESLAPGYVAVDRQRLHRLETKEVQLAALKGSLMHHSSLTDEELDSAVAFSAEYAEQYMAKEATGTN